MSIGVRRLTLTRRIRDLLQSYESELQLPEKWRGGRVERWFGFWKQLAADYKQAAVDAVQDCRDRPYRSGLFATLAGSMYVLGRTNPSYNGFEDNLLTWQSDMCTVGDQVRNPAAYEHLLELSHLASQRQLKRLDLGVCTLVFRQDDDPSVATFAATCSYLKPSYWQYLSERVVDVGIFNRWIVLDRQLIDFDVNESEWIEPSVSSESSEVSQASS
jgi:hypothetical protein